MKHQHGRESAGMIFITRFMNSFLHQASFATGYWYYDRHRSVRLVILVGLAIDQIAQSGLSSLSVIYYSAQLFSRGIIIFCCLITGISPKSFNAPGKDFNYFPSLLHYLTCGCYTELNKNTVI